MVNKDVELRQLLVLLALVQILSYLIGWFASPVLLLPAILLLGGAYLQSEVVEKKTDKTKGDRGDINSSSEVVRGGEIVLADVGGGESAEWINCLLQERWPSMHQGIFSFFSSTLAASPFPGVQIAWLNLGGAPRVGKVRVSGHRLEAIVSYFGEGGVELVLPLPGPLPSLNLALTNVHFEASLLVQLQPTLQLQLADRPYIDFNLGGLAYCLNLPGLASLTRQIVAEEKEKVAILSQHDRRLEDEEESDESKLEKGKDLEKRDKDNDTADKDKYNDQPERDLPLLLAQPLCQDIPRGGPLLQQCPRQLYQEKDKSEEEHCQPRF